MSEEIDKNIFKNIWMRTVKIEKDNKHIANRDSETVKEIIDIIDEEVNKCC